MKAARAPNLEERIKAIRAEINSIIDERVDTVSRESPGVPTGVIRNLLIARAQLNGIFHELASRF